MIWLLVSNIFFIRSHFGSRLAWHHSGLSSSRVSTWAFVFVVLPGACRSWLVFEPIVCVRFVSSHEFRIVLASLYFVVCIIARYPSFSWRWRSSRRGSAGGKAKVLLIDPISRDPSYCTHFGRSGRHTADVGGSLCYGRDRNHSRGDWIPSSSSDNKLGHVGHSIIGLCDKSAWVVGHPPGVSPSSLLRSRFRGQRSLVHQ